MAERVGMLAQRVMSVRGGNYLSTKAARVLADGPDGASIPARGSDATWFPRCGMTECNSQTLRVKVKIVCPLPLCGIECVTCSELSSSGLYRQSHHGGVPAITGVR